MKRQKDHKAIQSAVRLPQSLHERLQKAGGARGMGEEIRRRLELTFAGEGAATDEITDEVVAEIREIARDLSRYAPWHADGDAFDVFKAAVNALLSNHWPRGDPRPETKAHLRGVYGEKTPEDIGLILAHAAIFAYGRDRRGGLTGPTGLTGPAPGPTGSIGQRGHSVGSGSTGPTGPSGLGREHSE
jgi:hypothetical protein